MDFIHDRHSNILFSLYGSKVNRIKIHNKTLTLTVEEMYQLLDGEEKAFSGEICFNNCDVDLCKVLIFNKILGEGRFYGKSLCLQDFINEYVDVNVNIRMYNFDDVQCTVIPSVAYGFVTGMNLQLC